MKKPNSHYVAIHDDLKTQDPLLSLQCWQFPSCVPKCLPQSLVKLSGHQCIHIPCAKIVKWWQLLSETDFPTVGGKQLVDCRKLFILVYLVIKLFNLFFGILMKICIQLLNLLFIMFINFIYCGNHITENRHCCPHHWKSLVISGTS